MYVIFVLIIAQTSDHDYLISSLNKYLFFCKKGIAPEKLKKKWSKGTLSDMTFFVNYLCLLSFGHIYKTLYTCEWFVHV